MVYFSSKLIFVSFVITTMNVKRKQIMVTALKRTYFRVKLLAAA